MVKRIEPVITTRFVGTVKEIQIEPNELAEGNQYHIQMEPEDAELLKGSKTGCFHEFVRVPPKASAGEIPQGSILDKYLIELETLMPELKDKETHEEVFLSIKGKKFEFVQKTLGKAYGGHPAKAYWVPLAVK